MRRRLLTFAFLLAFLVFLPQLLSTPPGTFAARKILQLKTKANVQLDSLSLSWLGPQQVKGAHVSSRYMDASCKEFTAYMPLWRALHPKGLFTVSEGLFRVKSSSGEEAILEAVDAKIDGSQFAASGSTRQNGQSGSFAVHGEIEKFPTEFTLQGQMSSIPTLLLDQLTTSRYNLKEILGDFFSSDGSMQAKSGTTLIDINLSSSNGLLQIAAELDGKRLRLQKPLTASYILTPALSELLIKDINPLFLTAATSKSPVKLRISSELFEMSYDPFEIKNLRIESATLDMGRVSIRKGPSLESLLKLLQSRKMRGQEEVDAWFTPVSFQIQNGVLQTGRLDALLSGSIHICSWGKINLVSERLHMYLGLPADTLSHSFQITGLPSDYVLKIPFRGTISNPELETRAAAAQIASMAVAEQIPIPKVGKLFKTITKTASQIKNDKDVPPARRPFPWE